MWTVGKCAAAAAAAVSAAAADSLCQEIDAKRGISLLAERGSLNGMSRQVLPLPV
jgi:hypothetical protein